MTCGYLDLHILPRFEKMRLWDPDRGRIKLLLSEKLGSRLEKRTVHNIQAMLRVMLNAAIEDRVIASNPAAKLGRVLKLTVSNATTQEEIKPMTPAQRALFLATALGESPPLLSTVLCPSRNRRAVGRITGTASEDVDYSTKTIRVARASAEDGSPLTPKSGHGRTVDLSSALADSLARHLTTQKEDRLKHG